MLSETRAYAGRVPVQPHVSDFRDLADSRVRRKVRRTATLWWEASSSFPAAGPGGRVGRMNTGAFFHDSPGEPSPRRRFGVAAMSAPGIEHGRVSAFIRGSMEHMNRYTQEIRATTKRIAPCYTRHTNDRPDTGIIPEGREGRWRERVAGMLRPAPVAVAGSAGMRRGFYISRSKSRVTCAGSRSSSCMRSCSDSSERSGSRSVSRPGPDSRSRSGSITCSSSRA